MFFVDWKVFLFLLSGLMVAHVTQAAVCGLKPAKSGFSLPLLVADKAEIDKLHQLRSNDEPCPICFDELRWTCERLKQIKIKNQK